jgi:hypothetical protein
VIGCGDPRRRMSRRLAPLRPETSVGEPPLQVAFELGSKDAGNARLDSEWCRGRRHTYDPAILVICSMTACQRPCRFAYTLICRN